MILRFLPNQLGQKFTFAKVDRDERAAALKQALDLLALARVSSDNYGDRLTTKCRHTTFGDR